MMTRRQTFLILLYAVQGLLQRPNIYIVFGKAGAGKTTITERVEQEIECLCLDLDVCVTQKMRDNFNKGIYPTLEERSTFALSACDYLEKKLCSRLPCLVAFSFVNSDLRDIFRLRFPEAEWILVDTPQDVADLRIQKRVGHFYKGAPPSSQKDNSGQDDNNASQWRFAPVTFPHHILDGTQRVDFNAKRLIEIMSK